jgi:predicted RNA-binding protein
MCDSSAYLLSEDKEILLLEHIDFFEVSENQIRLVNIFGEEKRINGKIFKLSLLEHKIYFKPV